ncbi:hypothetical protein PR202_ga07767 [Eleusine coracana subsp. coracana]|uniref:Uncharacterized protein n=1 Tax=Eleusine coracana subsp. coracana TaxID=191504 RepID=A0AAV5C0U7_ELECO|nr:hypothetical protein PR202_ga07767 [Eleusine coracana subsp. coracana]
MGSINRETDNTSRETQQRRFSQLKRADRKPEEPCLDRIPNFHCNSLPSRYREANPGYSIIHKRGSMYQSSSEVSRLRNLQEGRGKIISSGNRDTCLSFEIANSSSQPSTSGISLSQQSRSCETRPVGKNHTIRQAPREFLNLSLREIPEDDLVLERPRRDCNLLKCGELDSFLEISLEEDTTEEDLHPHLEVAAIVIQVPFHKTKSKEVKADSSPGTIKAVTTGGAHGLPRDDEASPSPLLDRLKSGGACDCGGWDMSCPIVVLDNSYDSYWTDSVMNESKHPMELFVQSNKEILPALSMKADGSGHFSVDFHARLSALQAFSICISLLHCSEASSDIGIEKFKNKLYSSSLKMLLKDEVRQLIDSVTTKDKKKPKRRKAKTPSIVVDPPFSPMGRV